SFTAASFQVGANAGDNITIGSLADTTADNLSTVAYGENTVAAVDPDADITAFATAVTANLTIAVGGATAVDLGELAAASSATERLGQVVEAINRKTSDTGVSAFLVDNEDGTYDVELLSSSLDANGDPEAVVFGAGFTATGTGLVVADGAAIAAASAADSTGISNIDVTTEKGAYIAMKKLDEALDSVNGARAKLGAVQSRFENAVANIQIGVENLSASRGRIMDADFAKETANLSRSQILQQAGTAMVAQANQAVVNNRPAASGLAG
ncbi:flagellin, partial [Hydrogenophaga sp. Root209]|uniref:flagellin n=1 Tax=Hydrogenophaga sp. Root209 TaxID=1736490 RepID=UPI002285AEAE